MRDLIPHALVSIGQTAWLHKAQAFLIWAPLALWAALTDQFPPGVVSSVVILMVADWLLGTIRAWRTADVRWAGTWQGVKKFLVYLALIALVNHLARVELGTAWNAIMRTVLVPAVIAMMLLTEATSILRHLQFLAGRELPVLGWLLRRLEAEQQKLEQTD